MLELGHGFEREFEHVAGEVELAAGSQLPGEDLEHAGLDHPPLAVAGLEPWIGEQQVEAIDARRPKHAIEVDVDVDVAKREVGEAALARALAVALDQGLADLQPNDKPARVERGQIKRELGVGAAELDLHALALIRPGDRLGAGLEVLGPERVDVLTKVSHRSLGHSKPRPARHRQGPRSSTSWGSLTSFAMSALQPSVARRLAAELELERSLHGLLIHELGNPLQSLLILLELCRDELSEVVAGSGVAGSVVGLVDRPLERLERGLSSVNQLRQVLLSSSRIRASAGPDLRVDPRTGEHARWGQLLDELLEFVGERLTQLRAGLVRFTDEINRRPIAPGYVRAASLALVIGACRQIADARREGTTLELHGQALAGQTCLRVAIHEPAGPVELVPELVAQVEALLGGDEHSRCEREGRSLLLWSA